MTVSNMDSNSAKDLGMKKKSLGKLQKIGYGMGHILNDLCANCWFSYLLIFMTKVIGLSDAQAGLILLIGQVADALFTPFIGYGCDKTKIQCYGKRKFWHLIGTACVVLSFPFVFNVCLNCAYSSSTVQVAYYSVFVAVFQFGWAATQISHLSLIPIISSKQSETVELNAIRSGLTFICGVFVFGVTWLLLGTSTGEAVDSHASKEFMYLAIIVCSTGLIFTSIFHLVVTEPKQRSEKEKQESTDNPQQWFAKLCFSKRSTSCSNYGFQEENLGVPTSQENIDVNSEKEISSDTVKSNSLSSAASQTIKKKLWKDWFKCKHFYKTGLVYMCTRLAINVFQSFFVIYLTETLQFNKEAIAYFPLLVLISGGTVSSGIKKLTKLFGNKFTFIIGACSLALACLWLLLVSEKYRVSVYGAASLAGAGSSIMLVVVLAMTAELIGKDQESAAFVYSAMSFTDKLSTGLVIAIVQTMKPSPNEGRGCDDCSQFSRLVQSCIPGACALIAAFIVILFYPSQFRCKRIVLQEEKACQATDEDTAL